MTDFLHEQPPETPETPKETPEAPEKLTERQRTRRVFLYAVIFFATAFLLILWSFLMANRSSQDVLSELKKSASELQSSLAETGDIAELVSSLENNLNEAKEEAAQEKTRADRLQHSVLALDWLREIERAYAEKDTETAKKLIVSFIAHDLAQYLPEEPLQTARGESVPSAAETYHAIFAELFPEETP